LREESHQRKLLALAQTSLFDPHPEKNQRQLPTITPFEYNEAAHFRALKYIRNVLNLH
jgi:hypothetical protein